MSFERIFDEIEIKTEPFALCELQGQCSLGLESQVGTTLHYILAGTGEIIFDGQVPIKVERGTLVLVPTLRSHKLRSYGTPGHPIPECRPAELDLAGFLTKSENGPSDDKLLAICSHVNIGLRGASDLINLIRQPIIEKIAEGSPMLAAIDQMLIELSSPKLGSKALIRSLLLQCIIHMLRAKLIAKDPALNWMAALVDERLWQALREMLETPGAPHTVESLAEIAGMSRSSFAAKFSNVYDNGPMELLRDLRMNLAASLLSQSNLPVKRISELVGFKSRSSFSRAFTKIIGHSPDSFRRSAREDQQ